MAASVLNRSHATLWLPPRSVGERAFANEPLIMGYVRSRGDDEASARFARYSLDSLPSMKSATLIFDARDVTVLHATVPPLAGAKLRRALPNVIEDQILQDVASCAVVAGPTIDDAAATVLAEGGTRRLVAVIDRGWLEFVVGAFERRGVRIAGAWPAQLALSQREPWAIACVNNGLAMRAAPMDGFGRAAGEESAQRLEAVLGVLETAQLKYPKPERVLAFIDDPKWRGVLAKAAETFGVEFRIHGLPIPRNCPVELLDGRQAAGQRWFANFDWRAWRWPAILAAGALAAWLIGLNLHWGQLVGERNELRARMENRFKQTFPNAQVVVNPLLQTQRQVASLRARAGQSGPEDFLPLVSRLASALGPRAMDSMAAIEFREGQLKVRFQPSFVESRSVRDALLEACQRNGLKLRFENETGANATVTLGT